jgi:predicted nucleic acid-binding protein
VLRAKKHGVLQEAKPWLTKLVEAGMFIDAKLLIDALASVQE